MEQEDCDESKLQSQYRSFDNFWRSKNVLKVPIKGNLDKKGNLVGFLKEQDIPVFKVNKESFMAKDR